MPQTGTIETFDPKGSEISSYLERMEQLFICNDVQNAKKVSLFLTLIGGVAYNVLKDLLSPVLPSTKTYKELKDVLLNHCSPKRLVVAERYRFYSAK